MEQIADDTGATQYELCLHCTESLSATRTRDHVPSRGLLMPPYPAQLPTVDICADCNERFSKDEQYFALLLECVLSGCADPSEQPDLRVAKRLRDNPHLASRISNQRVLIVQGDKESLWWQTEPHRIETVVVKNARGHVMYEAGVPMHRTPELVSFHAMSVMTDTERTEFEQGGAGDSALGPLLPELGTRALTRAMTSADLVDDWVEVQRGRYRYMVGCGDSATVVRTVIFEYLATEVVWR